MVIQNSEMAEQHQPKGQALDQVSDDVKELEELEEDVKLMAQKISEFRETLPARLQNTLASILSAQRPVHSDHSDNDPGISGNPTPESGCDDAAKVEMIKQKIRRNASAMPTILKRANECMARMEKLDSSNKGIHPAFKRRKMRLM